MTTNLSYVDYHYYCCCCSRERIVRANIIKGWETKNEKQHNPYISPLVSVRRARDDLSRWTISLQDGRTGTDTKGCAGCRQVVIAV